MRREVCFFAALALGGGVATHAATIDVQGTLLPPACRVENSAGGDIQVDFGDDININRLNGSNYRQTVDYKVICDTDGQPWPLRLRFEGSSNAWDAQSLATSDVNLGIRLALNSNPVSFGVNYPVQSSANPPTLTAVPVSNNSADPAEGRFSATARLLAEYY